MAYLKFWLSLFSLLQMLPPIFSTANESAVYVSTTWNDHFAFVWVNYIVCKFILQIALHTQMVLVHFNL